MQAPKEIEEIEKNKIIKRNAITIPQDLSIQNCILFLDELKFMLKSYFFDPDRMHIKSLEILIFLDKNILPLKKAIRFPGTLIVLDKNTLPLNAESISSNINFSLLMKDEKLLKEIRPPERVLWELWALWKSMKKDIANKIKKAIQELETCKAKDLFAQEIIEKNHL